MKTRAGMVAIAVVTCSVFVGVPILQAQGHGGGGGGGGGHSSGGAMRMGSGSGYAGTMGTARAMSRQPSVAQPAQPHAPASGWNHSHSYGYHHGNYHDFDHNYYHHHGYYDGGAILGYVPVPEQVDVLTPPVDTSVNLPTNSDQVQDDAAKQQTAPENKNSLSKPKKIQTNSTRSAKPAALARNKRPGASLFASYSEMLARGASDTCQKESLSTLDQLEKQLPNDASVHDSIQSAKDAVTEGKPLPSDWLNNLKAAVKAAGGPINKDEANKCGSRAPGLVTANNLMASAIALGFGKDQLNANIPVGMASVIVCPTLPTNQIVLMPTGTLMAGTGGQSCVQVISADTATLLGLPLGTGAAIANATGDASKTMTRGILIRNPAENKETINFIVDSEPSSSLDPDYNQEIADAGKHSIRFSRGPDAGEASYDLLPGTYAFVPTDNGWDLQRESFSVTVDNSHGADDFFFVSDNHQKKVAAGGTQVISSNYPIVVRFNRGDAGVEGCKCITTADADLVVAVNPADGLWDLYPSDSIAPQLGNIAGSPSDTAAEPGSRLMSVLAHAGAKL